MAALWVLLSNMQILPPNGITNGFSLHYYGRTICYAVCGAFARLAGVHHDR